MTEKGRKDKTTNLLISSNVHYVNLGRDKNRLWFSGYPLKIAPTKKGSNYTVDDWYVRFSFMPKQFANHGKFLKVSASGRSAISH